MYKVGDKVMLHTTFSDYKKNVETIYGDEEILIDFFTMYGGSCVEIIEDHNEGMFKAKTHDEQTLNLTPDIIKGYAEEQIIPEYGEWYYIKDLDSPVKCVTVNRDNFIGKINTLTSALIINYSDIENKIADPEVLQDLSIGEAKKGARDILLKDIPNCIDKEFNRLPKTNTKTPMPPVKPPKKPLIGLKPLKLWEEGKDNKRTLDILLAMLRYSQEEKPVPREWVKELTGRVINLMDGTE